MSHASNCAVYNEPEMPAGPCNCYLSDHEIPKPVPSPRVARSPAADRFIAEQAMTDIFVRASAIASRRYPNGCVSAAILGDIVREVVTEQTSSASAILAFDKMTAGEDGWCDWIHPLPGYLMKCCGCGLIHEMEFEIGQRREGDKGPLNEGESDETGVIIFRARRADTATAHDGGGK